MFSKEDFNKRKQEIEDNQYDELSKAGLHDLRDFNELVIKENTIGCLKIQLKTLTGLSRDLQEENKMLNAKLEEAKLWLFEIADFRENRSDFERYMLHEWDYS